MFDLSLRATQRMLAAITVMMLPLGASAGDVNASPASADETFSASAVMDSELDNSRGAFVPNVMNFSTMSATNMGNTVTGGVTGNNSVTGAFNNSSGLVNVIQNSGNNVIIQSSTIVSMTFNK